MLQGTVPEAERVIKHLILLMMDQPVRNMQRKIVNVKKENKSVSSWKRNKEYIDLFEDAVCVWTAATEEELWFGTQP